jgi:hypothetical protein
MIPLTNFTMQPPSCVKKIPGCAGIAKRIRESQHLMRWFTPVELETNLVENLPGQRRNDGHHAIQNCRAAPNQLGQKLQ